MAAAGAGEIEGRDAFIIGRPSGRVWLADTPDRCVRSLTALRAAKCVAIDCEGINLSRDGTVCIVQVVDAAAQDDVHLFDITRLGSGGLDIRPDSHRSLRQLLGDDSVEKLFWDVRADNDALFNLHDVRLANVIDLQVLHLLERRDREGTLPRHVSGLQTVLERQSASVIPRGHLQEILAIKVEAKGMFAKEHGGSYEVWAERPLPEVLIQYCTDAKLFFALRLALNGSVAGAREREDFHATVLSRLAHAHQNKIPTRGPHMAVAHIVSAGARRH